MRHLDEAIALHNAALSRLEVHAKVGGGAGVDPDGNEYPWRVDRDDKQVKRVRHAIATELTGDAWERWPMWWTWPGGAEEGRQ